MRIVFAVAVSFTLLVAACGGDRHDEGGSATVPNTQITAATATSEAATSTTLSPEDTLRRRVVELFAIRTELLQHPDPNRITEWVAPSCPCFEGEKEILDEFATNGYRLDRVDAETIGVELTNQYESNYGFTVVRRGFEVRVVDASGAVIRTRPAFDLRGVSVTLSPTADGTYVVQVLVDLMLSPERLDEVTSQGVP